MLLRSVSGWLTEALAGPHPQAQQLGSAGGGQPEGTLRQVVSTRLS